MSELQDIVDSLNEASREIDSSTRHTIGWLMSVKDWNSYATQIGSDLWGEVREDVKQPKNCYYVNFGPHDSGCPFIDVPRFNEKQLLEVIEELNPFFPQYLGEDNF